MEIFPYILNRVCTVSHEKIEKLNSKGIVLAKLIDDYQELFDICKHQNELVSKLLFEAIGLIQDEKISDLMKRFRRDMYNGRINNLPDHIAEHLDVKTKKCILDHLNISRSQQKIFNKLEIQYSKARLSISNLLRKTITTNQTFQKGLLLSSGQLFSEIEKFKTLELGILNKKDQHTELAFLKYLSRTCSKTSPFSTFTSLSISELDKVMNEKAAVKDVVSHVRLNNQIFQYLRAILSRNKAIKRHLFLELNPTLDEHSSYFNYLINHNNLESIQKIPKDELIEAIVLVFRKSKRQLTFKKIRDLISSLTGQSYDNSEEYLERLVESGLINFDFQVSGLDPNWDSKFIKELKRIEKAGVSGISDLIQVLKILGVNSKKYGRSNVQSRINLLKESHLILKQICKKLYILADLPLSGLKAFGEFENEEEKNQSHTKEQVRLAHDEFRKIDNLYFNIKPEQVFYEDTLTNISYTFSSDKINQLVTNLNSLYNQLDGLDYGNFHKKINLNLYRKKFANGDADLSFLDFYKEFFKNYRSVFNNIPNSQEIEKKIKNKSWLKKISNQINLVVSNSLEVDLKSFFAESRSKKKLISGNSHGIIFQQFYNLNGEIEYVINGFLSGHGKWFGRFLHLFKQEVTDELRSRNKPVIEDDIYLEITDASFFNANIHPTLMPYESRIPGGNNFMPKSNQLLISDFVVKLDSKSQQLYLYHKKEQRRLMVFDLCFQTINGRSNIYQLLSRFSPNKEFNLNLICVEANKEIVHRFEDQTLCFPRLRLGNMIIQRKYWVVPRGSLPIRKHGESDAEYFLRVNIWRKKLQIPVEIFLRVSGRNFQNNKVNSKVGKDDYKPQYISFDNPLFVLLFEKNIKKAKENITIEEMLPSSKELMSFNNRKYVSEFLVQWYN